MTMIVDQTSVMAMTNKSMTQPNPDKCAKCGKITHQVLVGEFDTCDPSKTCHGHAPTTEGWKEAIETWLAWVYFAEKKGNDTYETRARKALGEICKVVEAERRLLAEGVMGVEVEARLGHHCSCRCFRSALIKFFEKEGIKLE